jgi:cytochrome c oxidase subunit 2
MDLEFINQFLNFDIFPESASTFAGKVDPLFYFLSIISIIASLGVFFALFILGIKFQRDPNNPRESHALHAPILEILWTVIPFFIFIGVFVWGAKLFADYVRAPEGALQIDVIAKQWMWKVQHKEGVREVNDLHVPVNQPIKITLTSQDVLHDYYLPAMRVKQDVIPGRFTYLWFEATKTGTFPIFCAEYCGTEHSMMKGHVTVLSQEGYAEWLAGGPKKSPVEAGEFLFQQRGCVTCHSGLKDARGPTLTGIYGSTGKMVDGEEVLKDDNYLIESILYSSKRVAEGYTPLMPAFANQLTADDVNNLIAYIKSLGGDAAAAGAVAADAAQPAAQQ